MNWLGRKCVHASPDPSKLDFVHSEIGASADLRMDKVPFNC